MKTITYVELSEIHKYSSAIEYCGSFNYEWNRDAQEMTSHAYFRLDPSKWGGDEEDIETLYFHFTVVTSMGIKNVSDKGNLSYWYGDDTRTLDRIEGGGYGVECVATEAGEPVTGERLSNLITLILEAAGVFDDMRKNTRGAFRSDIKADYWEYAEEYAQFEPVIDELVVA